MLLYGNVSEQHSLQIQHHKQCEDLGLEITLLSCSVFLYSFQILLKCVMTKEEESPVRAQVFCFFFLPGEIHIQCIRLKNVCTFLNSLLCFFYICLYSSCCSYDSAVRLYHQGSDERESGQTLLLQSYGLQATLQASRALGNPLPCNTVTHIVSAFNVGLPFCLIYTHTALIKVVDPCLILLCSENPHVPQGTTQNQLRQRHGYCDPGCV